MFLSGAGNTGFCAGRSDLVVKVLLKMLHLASEDVCTVLFVIMGEMPLCTLLPYNSFAIFQYCFQLVS